MGIVEWWNSGTVEWWNGFFPHRFFFACLFYLQAILFCVCVFVVNVNSTTL